MPSSIVVAISFHYFSIHRLLFLTIVSTKLIRYLYCLAMVVPAIELLALDESCCVVVVVTVLVHYNSVIEK